MTTPTPEEVKAAVEYCERNINKHSPPKHYLQTILSALKAEQERLDWLFKHCAIDVDIEDCKTVNQFRSAIDSLRNQTKDSK